VREGGVIEKAALRARGWLRLAENYEEAEVVGRTKAAEEARPVIQQQIRPKKGDL
jgi:hypothetical protein